MWPASNASGFAAEGAGPGPGEAAPGPCAVAAPGAVAPPALFSAPTRVKAPVLSLRRRPSSKSRTILAQRLTNDQYFPWRLANRS